MIAAEYEAIQLYMQLPESTDNELAIDVLKDIVDEERVHAGEFLRLLKELEPDEEKFYREGAEEVKKRSRKENRTAEFIILPMHTRRHLYLRCLVSAKNGA